VIARMFEAIPVVNDMHTHRHLPLPVSRGVLESFAKAYGTFFTDVLGLIPSTADSVGNDQTNNLMQVIINVRAKARSEKNFAMSDLIRDELDKLKIKLKDTASGTEWVVEN
jgi:cysteinyl-tRNA synthetase